MTQIPDKNNISTYLRHFYITSQEKNLRHIFQKFMYLFKIQKRVSVLITKPFCKAHHITYCQMNPRQNI